MKVITPILIENNAKFTFKLYNKVKILNFII